MKVASSIICFLFVCVVFAAKDLALPPLFVKNVGDFASQPSGLTYCDSTNRLYMNCDRCDFITEMDTRANFVQNLEFDDSHDDVEALACYSSEGYLYIGEEGIRKVTAFLLDDYRDIGDDRKELKEVFDFSVVTGSATSSRSGLEGMTVNDRTGEIYVANEKSPAMIVRVNQDGEQLDSNEIDYLRDISGLAYDSELDLLWVLSDQDEKVYLTDLSGTEVFDSWDLPVQNPEGIAINNNSDVKYLYIATDPSAPSGPQYLPLVVGFEKPLQGTGYSNFDPNNLPDFVTNPPPCDGCDALEENTSGDNSNDDDDDSNTSSNTSSKDDDDSSTAIKVGSSLLVVFIAMLILS